MTHGGMSLVREFLEDSRTMTGSIEDQRRALEAMAGEAVAPEGCRVEPGRLGGRPSERLVPPDAHDAAVLYLHGGGYCIGSLATHRDLAGRLALAAGCPVVTLDYRLAPEHPFPAALDDAVAAFGDLQDACPTGRIAVAGDSAGGGLTMALLLALRRARSPLPAGAVCFSPWTDLSQSSAAYERLADVDPMLTKENLDAMAAAYLGDGDPEDELASPLFAADFRGLPPVMIEAGADEVLVDDATALAERLRTDGVDVTATVWPEMIHVFQAFPGHLVPEADASIERAGTFIRDHLGLSPSATKGA